MKKGDIAFETLLKFILALLVIFILIGFFTGFLDNVVKWGCEFATDLVQDIPLVGKTITSVC